jgi:RNA polymerase sigma-54 factor
VRFEASQRLRTGQQMRMVPRLIQSMEVLQMPVAALQERIAAELERNVALEAADPGTELDLVRPEHERPIGGADADDGSAAGFERLRELERSYGDMLDGDGPPRARRGDGERDAKMDAMANAPDRGENLAERLLHDWRLADVDPGLRAPGAAVIEALDADGLLHASFDDLRAATGAAWDDALLARALDAVQSELEPPGIAARDVRESLLLQVEAALDGRDGAVRADPHALEDARTILADHWTDFLENRLPRIEQRAHLPMARIAAARDVLRRLRLAPGRDVAPEDARPVMPDVVVEYDADRDRYVAALADGQLPVLRVSPTYARMAKDPSTDPAARTFVAGNVRSAEWLIEAIHNRRSTLLRVVDEVLVRQRPWFDDGPEALRRLEMSEVAGALGLSTGTVSRAVSGKWMQTPRGMVELRRFFTGGVETADGSSAGWDAIRQMVREVVDAEDRGAPLSDEAIAARIKERGISIARRTVVKYREQLGIPSARHRKSHGT